jgi:hypothetical protein
VAVVVVVVEVIVVVKVVGGSSSSSSSSCCCSRRGNSSNNGKYLCRGRHRLLYVVLVGYRRSRNFMNVNVDKHIYTILHTSSTEMFKMYLYSHSNLLTLLRDIQINHTRTEQSKL